jgi:hypothetical protein
VLSPEAMDHCGKMFSFGFFETRRGLVEKKHLRTVDYCARQFHHAGPTNWEVGRRLVLQRCQITQFEDLVDTRTSCRLAAAAAR